MDDGSFEMNDDLLKSAWKPIESEIITNSYVPKKFLAVNSQSEVYRSSFGDCCYKVNIVLNWLPKNSKLYARFNNDLGWSVESRVDDTQIKVKNDKY